MKTIQLTQGKIALVDDDDFERVSQYKWCAHKYKNTYYARHTVGGGRKSLLMHRFILNITDSKIECDHRNKNGLDNQKANLRRCSHKQNSCNRMKMEGTTSKYKGVHLFKSDKKWIAQIKINRKSAHLGRFITETEAAHAYNVAAKKHYGEFASLNEI